MGKVIMGIIAAGLILCAAGHSHAEQVKLTFDDRQWEIGYEVEDTQQGMVEFVVKGENVNAWTELVTLQAFFGLQETATPESYMNGMGEGLRKACPDARTNLIRKGANDIVFDWEIKSCPGQEAQYEIDRVIAGTKALYVIHYATKKLPVAAETRDKWAGLLSAATLID